MNIIFIAPPAAGKGTLSDKLVSKYDYKHLSTGDLLRAEIKKKSDLGKRIDKIISKPCGKVNRLSAKFCTEGKTLKTERKVCFVYKFPPLLL